MSTASTVNAAPYSAYSRGLPSQQSSVRSPDSNDMRSVSKVHWKELSHYLAGKDTTSSRSNAREKLQKLTAVQFRELSQDVYDELIRRKRTQDSLDTARQEEEPFLTSNPQYHPKRNQARQKLATLPTSRFRDLASDVLYELDRRYPEFKEEDDMDRLTSQTQTATSIHGNKSSISSLTYSSKRPKSPPSLTDMQHAKQSSLSSLATRNMNMAANEVLVPNKSTLVEEDVSRPINSNAQQNAYPAHTRSLSRKSEESVGEDQRSRATAFRMESPPVSPEQSPMSNFGGIGRVSEASSIAGKLYNGYGGQQQSSSSGLQQQETFAAREKALLNELENVKKDYEYQIAGLQARLTSIERQLSDSQRDHSEAQQHSSDVDNELMSQIRKNQEQADAISQHLEEIDNLRNMQSDHAQSRSRLREKEQEVERLSLTIKDLKKEISTLIEECQGGNDQLDTALSEKDDLVQQVEQVQAEIETWRKKYQEAKTELRNIKATSQLFVASQRSSMDMEDFMPASENGVIADIHMTAFQSSIDEILATGRSNTPSSVLKVANNVVLAVTKLDEDVQSFESSSSYQRMSETDKDKLQAIKSKIFATLSNLITAAKNHSNSKGFSPVSLLDAAASHLSATIVELVKLLKIRKATAFERANQHQRAESSPLPLSSVEEDTQYQSSSVEGLRIATGPMPSNGSKSNEHSKLTSSPMGLASSSIAKSSSAMSNQQPSPRNGPMSQRSYDQGSDQTQQNSATSFDLQRQPNLTDTNLNEREQEAQYDAGQDEYGSEEQNEVPMTEEEWYRFKDFLAAATTDIVRDIQKLLAALRSRDDHSVDELTKIVSTVSTILAEARDHLPFVDSSQWDLNCLNTLQMECEKLADMQASAMDSSRANGKTGAILFDKTANAQVTQATYQVVKAMKALNVMFEDRDPEDDLT